MVLRYIAEDVFTYTTPVTVSRKEDLRNALIAITSRAPVSENDPGVDLLVPLEIYGACNVQPGNDGWLFRISKCLFANIDGYNSGGKENRENHERIALLCINTLTAYLEWLPLRYIAIVLDFEM